MWYEDKKYRLSEPLGRWIERPISSKNRCVFLVSNMISNTKFKKMLTAFKDPLKQSRFGLSRNIECFVIGDAKESCLVLAFDAEGIDVANRFQLKQVPTVYSYAVKKAFLCEEEEMLKLKLSLANSTGLYFYKIKSKP